MLRKLLILAAVMLAGCTYDDSREYNPQLSLMFQPDMYMHTAHNEVERFPTQQTIAVRAWSLPDSLTWEQASHKAVEFLPLSEAAGKEVFITDTTLKNTVKDTLWVITESTVWPDNHEKLNFLAFSPFAANCGCNIETGITYTTNTLEDQTDLLYTAPHTDLNKINNGWVVPLKFMHALSRIDFRIKHRVAENEKITVTKIVVDAIGYKGRFQSLSTPQWNLDLDVSPITIFEGREQVNSLPSEIGRYWFVIPQKLNTKVTVEFEFTNSDGNTITQKIQTAERITTTLNGGETYTYTLSVGIDDVKFLKELIENKL